MTTRDELIAALQQLPNNCMIIMQDPMGFNFWHLNGVDPDIVVETSGTAMQEITNVFDVMYDKESDQWHWWDDNQEFQVRPKPNAAVLFPRPGRPSDAG